jgi:hypothetical protein
MLRWQFRRLIEEGRAQRTVAAKRRIYRKGVIDGQFASLQLYLAKNWSVGSSSRGVSVITNVVQRRSPEEVKGPPD